MGSDNDLSDLDFSFIRWDRPVDVVKGLIEFYTDFKSIFGAYPAQVFDMNFYIGEDIVANRGAHQGNPAQNCYTTTVQPALPMMFQLTAGGGQANCALYELFANYGNFNHPGATAAEWTGWDRYITYFVQWKRLYHDQHPLTPPKPALENLIRFSALFYKILDGIRLNRGGPYTLNSELTLFLNGIFRWMKYFSDEAYISRQALVGIWFDANTGQNARCGNLVRNPPLTLEDYYIAILDQFSFIKRYAYDIHRMTTATNPQKVARFWFKTCKYYKRIMKILHQAEQLQAVQGNWGEANMLNLANIQLRNPQLYNIWTQIEAFAIIWDTKNPYPNPIGRKRIRGNVPADIVLGVNPQPNNPLYTYGIQQWGLFRTAMNANMGNTIPIVTGGNGAPVPIAIQFNNLNHWYNFRTKSGFIYEMQDILINLNVWGALVNNGAQQALTRDKLRGGMMKLYNTVTQPTGFLTFTNGLQILPPANQIRANPGGNPPNPRDYDHWDPPVHDLNVFAGNKKWNPATTTPGQTGQTLNTGQI